MKYFFLFILFSFKCFAEVSIAPSAFSVEMAVSANTISLDEDISLHIQLKYPKDFHPHIELMKRRLLNYAGFFESPFTLVNTNISPPQINGEELIQKIEFVLSPQRLGNHYLTFQKIPFVSSNKEDKTVEIISDIFPISVESKTADIDFAALIESPMPLSDNLPITISYENKKNYVKNKQLLDEEAKTQFVLLNSKTFPWITLIAVCAAIFTILLVRLLPSEPTAVKDEKTKEENEQEIKQAILNLSERVPQDSAETKDFILQLDFLLRRYLVNLYGFPAFSYTKQELQDKLEKLRDMNPVIKNEMNKTFQVADQIKFSNYSPSPKIFFDLVEQYGFIEN